MRFFMSSLCGLYSAANDFWWAEVTGFPVEVVVYIWGFFNAWELFKMLSWESLPQLVIRSLQSWPRGFGATLSRCRVRPSTRNPWAPTWAVSTPGEAVLSIQPRPKARMGRLLPQGRFSPFLVHWGCCLWAQVYVCGGGEGSPAQPPFLFEPQASHRWAQSITAQQRVGNAWQFTMVDLGFLRGHPCLKTLGVLHFTHHFWYCILRRVPLHS